MRPVLACNLQAISAADRPRHDELLQRILSSLCELNIVQRGESGAWLLSRDLDRVRLGEIYEGLDLRIPTGDPCLPARQDAIGRAASETLDELTAPLREPLSRSVGSYLKSIVPREPKP